MERHGGGPQRHGSMPRPASIRGGASPTPAAAGLYMAPHLRGNPDPGSGRYSLHGRGPLNSIPGGSGRYDSRDGPRDARPRNDRRGTPPRDQRDHRPGTPTMADRADAPPKQSPIVAPLEKTRALLSSLSSRDLQGHRKCVRVVAWSATGKRLASGGTDHATRLWDPQRTDTPLNELRGHEAPVDHLCWHPTDDNLLATVSSDRTVRIWDLRDSRRTADAVRVVRTEGENINVLWTPDGTQLAVGSRDDAISVIDAAAGAVQRRVAFDVEINELAWTLRGAVLLAATGSGRVRALEWPTLTVACDVNAHPASCYCVEADRSGALFATGAADALVGLWDARELACVRTFGRLDYPIRSLSFSHDSQLLAIAGDDPWIDVAFVADGSQALKLPVPTVVSSLAWHPTRLFLAMACDDDPRRHPKGVLRVFGFSDASV